MPSAMTGKIILAVGAVLLGMQVQGNDSIPSASSNQLDDLQSVKDFAFELISNSHEKFSSEMDEMMNYTKNSYDWIWENKVMNDQIGKTSDGSVDKIRKTIEELTDNAEEGKPEEFFLCLEEEGQRGIAKILEEVKRYKSVVQPFQTAALEIIDRRMYSMDKMFHVVDGVKDELLQRIDRCEDDECVLTVVQETNFIFSHAKSLFTSLWNDCVGAFFKYKNAARKKLTEAEETISRLLEDTRKELRMC